MIEATSTKLEPWQFLFRAAAFSGLFAVVYPLLVVAWALVVPSRVYSNIHIASAARGYSAARLAEAEEMGPVDVLILGSSHAYRGADPRVLAKAEGKDSLRVFNLGTSNQTHLQTAYLLDRFLKKLQPKAVLYEVSPDVATGRGAGAALDLALSDSLSANLFWYTLRARDLKAIHVVLFRAVAEPFGLWALADLEATGVDETYLPGGYARYDGKRVYRHGSETFEALAPTASQLGWLQKNVDRLLGAGARVYLYRAPVVKEVHAFEVDAEEYSQRMQAIAPYMDFNGRIELIDTVDFYDARHMRPPAVTKFSEALRRHYLE